jgi:hypothetical protein
MATAAHAQTYCVFDPSGAQGDSFQIMKDYSIAAKQWGADLTLKAYRDEEQIFKDFKSGKCDAAAMTAIRARPFNKFVTSIDSVGGLVNKEQTKIMVTLMANPKLASSMIDNGVEVAGVLSVGMGYVIVNDRKINNLQLAIGKRMAIFDYDKAGQAVIEKVGAIPVPVTLSTIGPKFNNGDMDIIYLPAIAFKPLDIAKGLGATGAVMRFPVVSVTYDVLLNADKFPEGYGQKSRNWFVSNLNKQMAAVDKIERSIEPRYWADIPPNDAKGYTNLLRAARISLTRSGTYDKRMMGILKKVRCSQEPSNSECTMTDE